MEPPNTTQKAIIISFILLKLLQFSLQMATVITSWDAFGKIVFISCFGINILAVIGNIGMFIYQIVEDVKFECEILVFVFLVTANFILVVVLSVDIQNISKSNDTVDLHATKDIYAGDPVDPVDYEPVDYGTVYKKVVSLMVFTIVIECIVYYLARKITYEGPVLWFWDKWFPQDEEEIPLEPHAQPIVPIPPSNVVSQVVVNPPSVTRRSPRTSQRDSLETEEIDCEGAVRYVPEQGIDLPKKSTAESRPKKDVINSEALRSVPQEGMGFPKKSVAEGKAQKDWDNSGAVRYNPLEGIDVPKKSVAEGRPQKDGDSSLTDLNRIKRKQFRPIKEEASPQHQCSDFHRLEFPHKEVEESSPKQGASHKCGDFHRLEFPPKK